VNDPRMARGEHVVTWVAVVALVALVLSVMSCVWLIMQPCR
jgi:hypothetical protein